MAGEFFLRLLEMCRRRGECFLRLLEGCRAKGNVFYGNHMYVDGGGMLPPAPRGVQRSGEIFCGS